MAIPVVVPRPAATVVLLRPGPVGLEALLTHRPPTMAFAADMHVFPGGRVDPTDADPRVIARSTITPDAAARALGGDLAPVEAVAAFIAAIREAFEEAGVLLAATTASPGPIADARARLLSDHTAFPEVCDTLDLRLQADALVPLSRWVTPPGMARRFDARFFAAMAPDDAELSLVGDEVAAGAWVTPRAALDAMAVGTMGMWLPTSATLQQLEFARSIEDVRAAAPGALGDIEADEPAFDIVRIRMPAGGGVAGQPVWSYLVGRQAFVLVDPGDPTGPALDRAVAEAIARGGTIVGIALTHVDADHAAGVEALTEQLGVPSFAASHRVRDLPYPVTPLADGDLVPVGDVAMRVVATPGPTADHVAFVIGDGTTAIVGDLDGIRGARAIVGPTDAAAWARSRDRLRALAPHATWLGGHPTP